MAWTLGERRGATFGRIKAQAGERARLGMAVITRVSHSRRPLLVDEIHHAVEILVRLKQS